jgi:hypothetical protein
MKAIEPTGEETGKLERRNVSELSLLKKNNSRIRRKQLHKDITTLLRITQASNIPTAN